MPTLKHGRHCHKTLLYYRYLYIDLLLDAKVIQGLLAVSAS